jgi:hypothetical protein
LISQRVGRGLERQGLLEQDTESAWLDLNPGEDTDAMPQILGSSVSYRIAVGPQQGSKAFMIRTIRPLDRPDPGRERVAVPRLALSSTGKVVYTLKARGSRFQLKISRDATEEFIAITFFVPGFEGERKRSTRPAMQVLTAGTARAVFLHFRSRDYFLDVQLLSTPH